MGLSSQHFFVKFMVVVSVFFMSYGFKAWMKNEFVPFKDIFMSIIMIICALVFGVIEVMFTILGKIAKL